MNLLLILCTYDCISVGCGAKYSGSPSAYLQKSWVDLAFVIINQIRENYNSPDWGGGGAFPAVATPNLTNTKATAAQWNSLIRDRLNLSSSIASATAGTSIASSGSYQHLINHVNANWCNTICYCYSDCNCDCDDCGDCGCFSN